MERRPWSEHSQLCPVITSIITDAPGYTTCITRLFVVKRTKWRFVILCRFKCHPCFDVLIIPWNFSSKVASRFYTTWFNSCSQISIKGATGMILSTDCYPTLSFAPRLNPSQHSAKMLAAEASLTVRAVPWPLACVVASAWIKTFVIMHYKQACSVSVAGTSHPLTEEV